MNSSGKKEILDIRKGTFSDIAKTTSVKSSDDHDSAKFAIFVRIFY